MVVYTIGTSNRNLDDFINILKAYNISVLLDVRSFPKSRRFPWFNRAHLARALIEHKIKYVFLGKELGGFRKDGFEPYTQTEDYKKGLDKVETIASKNKAVIMCVEKLPDKCHRRLIAEDLKERGIDIIHIIEKDKTMRQPPRQLSIKLQQQ